MHVHTPESAGGRPRDKRWLRRSNAVFRIVKRDESILENVARWKAEGLV